MEVLPNRWILHEASRRFVYHEKTRDRRIYDSLQIWKQIWGKKCIRPPQHNKPILTGDSLKNMKKRTIFAALFIVIGAIITTAQAANETCTTKGRTTTCTKTLSDGMVVETIITQHGGGFEEVTVFVGGVLTEKFYRAK